MEEGGGQSRPDMKENHKGIKKSSCEEVEGGTRGWKWRYCGEGVRGAGEWDRSRLRGLFTVESTEAELDHL